MFDNAANNRVDIIVFLFVVFVIVVFVILFDYSV